MATSISTLSSLLLNPYAQNALSAAQNKSSIDPIKPGATINARYVVEEDGALQLQQVELLGQGQQGAANSQRKTFEESLNRPSYTLGDIAKPRATLTPADEAAIFSSGTAQAQRPGTPKLSAPVNPGITDIEPDDATPSANVVSLEAQKQQRVANLYARNLDITYNVDPVFSQAA